MDAFAGNALINGTQLVELWMRQLERKREPVAGLNPVPQTSYSLSLVVIRMACPRIDVTPAQAAAWAGVLAFHRLRPILDELPARLLPVAAEHDPFVLDDRFQMDRLAPQLYDVGQGSLHVFQIQLHAFVFVVQEQLADAVEVAVDDDDGTGSRRSLESTTS